LRVSSKNQNPCIFCKIINKEIPSKIIKETDSVLVIEDIAPKAPVHYLVLPKKHIQNLSLLAQDDYEYVLHTIKVINELSQELVPPAAFNVIANNGAGAGQSVFHLHWHFISGKNIYDGGFSL